MGGRGGHVPIDRSDGYGFAEYMAAKIAKLGDQMGAHAANLAAAGAVAAATAGGANCGGTSASSSSSSSLFAGVTVHVNGHTVPPHSTLRDLMAAHGGGFANYYSRAAVTHIICANLPDGKVREVAKSGGPPIVRPEWVTASLAAGRLLPVGPFLLVRPGPGPGQRALVARPPGPPLARAAGAEGPAAAPVCWGGGGGGGGAPPPPPPPPPTAPSPPTTSSHTAAATAAAAARAGCAATKGPPRSSADDTTGAFIASFHAASRLHFIGAWRARAETVLAAASAAADAHTGSTPRFHPLPGAPRTVIHLDMDAFFAAVAVARCPALAGAPLAVCHSNAAGGSGEVACASYEARASGVRAGWAISAAKAACPGLVVVPYDFPAYEAASVGLYTALLSEATAVQPLSVDEAYIDATGHPDPAAWASRLRARVQAATGGCPASAGVGPNPLLARLASEAAKPAGQAVVTAADADGLLLNLPIEALPGVGWAAQARLAAAGITTVAAARAAGRGGLVAALGSGAAAASALWDAAHGRDDRPVVPGLARRRTIGAECNWGVRPADGADAERLVGQLAASLAARLADGRALAGSVTLKLKVRRPGAGEPHKHLGHGICDNLARSGVVAGAPTRDAARLAAVGVRLLRAAAPGGGGGESSVPAAWARELRGVGLVASRLATDDEEDGGGGGGERGPRQAALPGLLLAAATAGRAGGDAAASPPAKRARGNAPPPPPPPPPPPAHTPSPPPFSPPCEGWVFESASDDDGGGFGGYGGRAATTSSSRSPGEHHPAAAAPSATPAGCAPPESLSQIDAAVFQALPPSLQAELVASLPRSRGGERKRPRELHVLRPLQHQQQPHRPPPLPPPRPPADTATTSIQALPPLSQVDRATLDALPLGLRRELEGAWGLLRQTGPGALREASPGGGGGPGRRQPRLTGFLSPPPGWGPKARGGLAPSPHPRPPAPPPSPPPPIVRGAEVAAALTAAAAALTSSSAEPDTDPACIAASAGEACGAAAAWARKRARLGAGGDLEGAAAVGRALARLAEANGPVAAAAAASLAEVERGVRKAIGARLRLG